MFTERELCEAIRECEGAPSSFQNCEKLAVFHALYDKYFADDAETRVKTPEIRPVSDSEFMTLIAGKDWSSLLAILDELMDTVKILQPRLFDAVMHKLRE